MFLFFFLFLSQSVLAKESVRESTSQASQKIVEVDHKCALLFQTYLASPIKKIVVDPVTGTAKYIVVNPVTKAIAKGSKDYVIDPTVRVTAEPTKKYVVSPAAKVATKVAEPISSAVGATAKGIQKDVVEPVARLAGKVKNEYGSENKALALGQYLYQFSVGKNPTIEQIIKSGKQTSAENFLLSFPKKIGGVLKGVGRFLLPIPVPSGARNEVEAIFYKLWLDSNYVPLQAEETLLKQNKAWDYFQSRKEFFIKNPNAKAVNVVGEKVLPALTLLGTAAAVNQAIEMSKHHDTFDNYLNRPSEEENGTPKVELLVETTPFPHSALRIGGKVYSYGQEFMTSKSIYEYFTNSYASLGITLGQIIERLEGTKNNKEEQEVLEIAKKLTEREQHAVANSRTLEHDLEISQNKEDKVLLSWVRKIDIIKANLVIEQSEKILGWLENLKKRKKEIDLSTFDATGKITNKQRVENIKKAAEEYNKIFTEGVDDPAAKKYYARFLNINPIDIEAMVETLNANNKNNLVKISTQIGDLDKEINKMREAVTEAKKVLENPSSSAKSIGALGKYLPPAIKNDRSVRVVPLHLPPGDVQKIQRYLEMNTGKDYNNKTMINDCNTMIVRALEANSDIHVPMMIDAFPSAASSYLSLRRVLGDTRIGPTEMINSNKNASVPKRVALNTYIGAMESKLLLYSLPINMLARGHLELTSSREDLEYYTPDTQTEIDNWRKEINRTLKDEFSSTFLEGDFFQYTLNSASPDERKEKVVAARRIIQTVSENYEGDIRKILEYSGSEMKDVVTSMEKRAVLDELRFQYGLMVDVVENKSIDEAADSYKKNRYKHPGIVRLLNKKVLSTRSYKEGFAKQFKIQKEKLVGTRDVFQVLGSTKRGPDKTRVLQELKSFLDQLAKQENEKILKDLGNSKWDEEAFVDKFEKKVALDEFIEDYRNRLQNFQ